MLLRRCWKYLHWSTDNLRDIYTGVPTTFVMPVLEGSDLMYEWTVVGPSHTVVETDGSRVVIVFNNNASYVVSVMVWNNVSSADVDVEVVSRGVTCCPPSVDLVGSDSRSALRSRTIRVETVVSTDCLDYRLEHEWSVWIGNCIDDETNSYVSLPRPIRTDTPTLFLPARTLNYGIYCVKFQTCLHNAPGCNNVSVDLAVKESSLRALIAGGDERSVVASEKITFDGSFSYDPDVDRDASSLLTYNWTCEVVYVTTLCPFYTFHTCLVLASRCWCMQCWNQKVAANAKSMFCVSLWQLFCCYCNYC